MSAVSRHIAKLNRLLLVELGERPPYQWVYSESPEFKRAYRLMDDGGMPLFNYRCPCGLNATVHSPDCLVAGVVAAEPIFEIRKTDRRLTNQWVMCCQQPLPSRELWLALYGTQLLYPSHGAWAPVSTEDRVLAMPPGTVPGEVYTQAIINGRRYSREIPDGDVLTAHDDWERKQEASRKHELRDRIVEHLPISLNVPGTRGGSISWGGV